jgi:hypothetical protein
MKITDNQALLGATHGAFRVPTYDNGYGPLWALHESFGNFSSVTAVIRAQSFETAHEIAEQEFLPEASETIEELKEEYGFKREHIKIIKPIDGPERPATAEDYPRTQRPAPDGRWSWDFVRWQTIETPDAEAWRENECFQENYGFRPSGPNHTDKIGHGIYQTGHWPIERLTTKDGITLEIAEL